MISLVLVRGLNTRVLNIKCECAFRVLKLPKTCPYFNMILLATIAPWFFSTHFLEVGGLEMLHKRT
jgi:hypothetical protein